MISGRIGLSGTVDAPNEVLEVLSQLNEKSIILRHLNAGYK